MRRILISIVTCFLYFFPASEIVAQGIYQIYGTTAIGGSFGQGVIFSMDSSGNNYFERHSIGLAVNGKNPLYGAPVYFNGKFYGACSSGGGTGLGMLYSYDPVTQTIEKKIDFNKLNGSSPQGGLTLYNGKLYGMTFAGGFRDSGIIFQWDPVTNVFEKKIEFSSVKGAAPAGSLLLLGSKFYGLTSKAGQNNKGTVFSWDPLSNQFNKLADFDGTNGAGPFGGLTYLNNKFYGLCYQGGSLNQGTLFEFDPSTNQISVKANLGSSTGYFPYGNLSAIGSKLYGMTTRGGTADFGTIFEYDVPSNSLVKKIDLAIATGGFAYGDLIYNGQSFYGFAGFGGANFFGVIFEWNPVTNVFTNKYSFTALDGKNPAGNPTILNGKLYGTTKDGGVNSIGGSFFEFDLASSTMSNVVGFNVNSPVRRFTGYLTPANGKFYSLANLESGAIVEWDPSAETFARLYEMKEESGYRPYSSLTFYNNKLYGTNQLGGSEFRGNIFEFDPVSGEYTNKVNMTDAGGSFPLGELVLLNGKFYGTAATGGTDGAGVLFEWDPATNIYTPRFSFPQINNQWPKGLQPEAGLVEYNGKLYGTTRYGGEGNDDKGVLFEWNPANNDVNVVYNFAGNNGEYPLTTPVLVNGVLYGVTSAGGTNDLGVLYQYDLGTNLFSKMIDFGGNNGSLPQGKLLYAHGKFYGMTQAGGNNGRGCVYEWDPATNVLSRKKDFVISGANAPDGNSLAYLPAPVAKGTAGICTAGNSITIDASNSNKWVAVTDSKGDAIAEINANGNILGLVNVSFYINKNEVREDENHRLYLDRNISISPAIQPTSPVSIRLYITRNEFETLKNAYNSLGQPSGIQSPSDLAVFTNSVPCATGVQTVANQLISVVAPWNNDYVVTASVNHFSSFYFSNKAYSIIPVQDLKFDGNWSSRNIILNWQSTGETALLKYDIERKLPAGNFEFLGSVNANNLARSFYTFTDSNVNVKAEEVVFYRLKIWDVDGKFNYSSILRFTKKNQYAVSVYPNPAYDKIYISIDGNLNLPSFIKLIDAQGRILKQLPITSRITEVSITGLSAGIFFLQFPDGHIEKALKLN